MVNLFLVRVKGRVLIVSANLSRLLQGREAYTLGLMGLELHPTGANKHLDSSARHWKQFLIIMIGPYVGCN